MFCNFVRKITGSTDCISQTVRLERFMADYEDIKIASYPSEVYGIKVLLTADSETRKSYYLDDKEILVLNKNESYIDEINNLSFYKTDFRFDDYKSYKCLFMQNKDENEIICFTHEWILQFPIRKNLIKYCMQQYRCSRIKKNIVLFMNYCKDNNYTFVTDF